MPGEAFQDRPLGQPIEPDGVKSSEDAMAAAERAVERAIKGNTPKQVVEGGDWGVQRERMLAEMERIEAGYQERIERQREIINRLMAKSDDVAQDLYNHKMALAGLITQDREIWTGDEVAITLWQSHLSNVQPLNIEIEDADEGLRVLYKEGN